MSAEDRYAEYLHDPHVRAIWDIAHQLVESMVSASDRIKLDDPRAVRLRDALLGAYEAGAQRSTAQMRQVDSMIVDELRARPPVAAVRPPGQQDRIQRALHYADQYAAIDGGHHKMWVIDQMVRALTGCPIETRTARDSRGTEFTYEAQGESEEYLQWVMAYEAGDEGAHTYKWDQGIPP